MTTPSIDLVRPFEPDWAQVSRRVHAEPWAREAVAALAADFEWWRGRLVIPGPETASGWTHHYYCGRDGAKLSFQADQPHRHVCPQCGHVYSGEPWDNAWVTLMNGATAGQLERASILGRIAAAPLADEARAEADRIVAHYAERYLDYAVHGQHAGKGRVQPQNLDEAIWAVTLFRAVRWGGADRLSETLRARIDTVAHSIIALLRPQIDMIHNIHCWMLAAVTECAVWLGDAEVVDWCRHGEFGIEAQIARGFHAEGLWHEINPHYHYYTVNAVLSYREAAGPRSLSLEASQRLVLAINNPPRIAYADGRLPAYADGWATRYLDQYAALVEMARALFPEASIDLASYYRNEQLSKIRMRYGNEIPESDSPSLSRRGSVAALVFGADTLPQPGPIPAESFVWPQTGLVLLRNDNIRLALRFGPDGGGHDHRDKLNVDIETASGWQSLDLGTSGYGSAFTQWMRSPIAHNLIVIDGATQPAHAGRLSDSSASHLVAESDWEGVLMRREIALVNSGWTDRYVVETAGRHRIEWCFHGDGIFMAEAGEGGPATLSGDGGYDWLHGVRLISRTSLPGGVLKGAWRAPGGASVELTLWVPPDFDVYIAEADGNPNGRPFGLVLLRGQASRAVFDAHFKTST